MMSELTRLRDEALRLLTIYEEHKDSSDEFMRRKVHLDLDHFLMNNREVAAMLMVRGLNDEILALRATKSHRSKPWYRRMLSPQRVTKSKGGTLNANSNTQ